MFVCLFVYYFIIIFIYLLLVIGCCESLVWLGAAARPPTASPSMGMPRRKVSSDVAHTASNGDLVTRLTLTHRKDSGKARSRAQLNMILDRLGGERHCTEEWMDVIRTLPRDGRLEQALGCDLLEW